MLSDLAAIAVCLYLGFWILVVGFIGTVVTAVLYLFHKALNDPNIEWTVEEEGKDQWKIRGRRKT